jgi:hypothetical protein
MDLKELLGDLYTPEIAAKVGDKKIAVVSDGNWFPKEKFDAVNTENKQLKETIKTHETQLETLKTQAAGNEALQKQIADLQAANTAATADLQKKLEQQAFDFALEKALDKAKAKNPKAVKALLSVDKVKIDGENLIGLTEQLDALKKSDAYLFGEEEQGGGGFNPPGGTGGMRNPYDRAAGTFNLTEQARLERDNPTLAAQLAAAAGYKL